MARITDEDIAKVREATDLVGLISERVVLKQRGRLFWGNCPFHGEKTPSFKVDPASGLWHCFGCGKGGDVFKYLQYQDNLDFPEAVTMLAERANIEIVMDANATGRSSSTQAARAVCKDTTDYFHAVLMSSRAPAAAGAREYLGKRGFGTEVSKQWQLGFAPGRGALVSHLRTLGHTDKAMIDANVAVQSAGGQLRDRFYDRVMFPIFDIQGRPIAFGGRIIGDGTPKYLNSNDTVLFHKSTNLYGLNQAKNSIVENKSSVVVEGYTDVIALHKAGIANAVATLGTALTVKHVKLLGRFANRIVYVFDGDEAGQRAADRAVEFIDSTITPESSANPVVLDVVVLPSDADPADLVATEEGRVRFNELLDTAEPLIEFAINRRLARWNLDRPEERQRALVDCAQVLAPIKNSMMATDYAQYIVDKMWAAGLRVDIGQVLKAIAEVKIAPGRAQNDSSETQEVLPQQNYWSQTMSQDENIERQLLAVMIASGLARTGASQRMVVDYFTAPLHRHVYEFLLQQKPDNQVGQVLAKLETSFPGSSHGFSHYDFEFLVSHEIALVDELTRRLELNYLEREIRLRTAQLRNASNDSEKQSLMLELVSLKKQIIARGEE